MNEIRLLIDLRKYKNICDNQLKLLDEYLLKLVKKSGKIDNITMKFTQKLESDMKIINNSMHENIKQLEEELPRE
jgi:hypothetical protein